MLLTYALRLGCCGVRSKYTAAVVILPKIIAEMSRDDLVHHLRANYVGATSLSKQRSEQREQNKSKRKMLFLFIPTN